MKITMKWPLMAALCVIGFSSMVSCDDENDTPTYPSIVSLNGDYKGTMVSTMGTVDAGKSDIEFSISGDTIRVDSLPVKTLVKAMLGEGGTEEIVDGIVKALGSIEYNIGFTYTAKADGSSAELVLDPKPLMLNANIDGTELSIKVIVGSKDKGTYLEATKNLKFNLEVTDVDSQILENVISIAFEVKKQ